mgnify:FL=1
MQSKKKASAPSYHTPSARMNRIENDASTIIPFERKKRPTAKEMQDASQFKAGVLVGFLAATIIFLIVLWAWVIPTMDGAVATAQQAYETTAGVVHA